MNLAVGQRVTAHGVDQRCEQNPDAGHPIPHCARIDLDALTRVHDCLAVQRDVVRKLRHGDVCEQCRTWAAAIDRPTWCRSLHDAIAARAGQLRTAVTAHAEVRPDVFVLFRDVFAERFELYKR